MTGLYYSITFGSTQDSFLEYILFGRLHWVLFFFWLMFYLIFRYRTKGSKRIISLGLLTVIWVLISLVFIIIVSSYWMQASIIVGVYLLIQSFIVGVDMALRIIEERKIKLSK